MSDSTKGVGVISWFDLTVENADEVRDFYEKVVGWTSSQVEMGGYSDFNMETPEQKTVAGICHARGENADLPAQWMIYINVADLDARLLVSDSVVKSFRHRAKSAVGDVQSSVIRREPVPRSIKPDDDVTQLPPIRSGKSRKSAPPR